MAARISLAQDYFFYWKIQRARTAVNTAIFNRGFSAGRINAIDSPSDSPNVEKRSNDAELGSVIKLRLLVLR